MVTSTKLDQNPVVTDVTSSIATPALQVNALVESTSLHQKKIIKPSHTKPYIDSRPDDYLHVLFGSTMLTGMAGYINAVMLNYYSVPLSHMTGATTRLGIDFGHGDFHDFISIGLIVGGFLLGAFLSALIIGQSSTIRSGRRYGVALTLEGIILFWVCYFALHDMKLAVPLASLACGLQNGMASSYKGLVIRTTHVTGTVTDIGVLLGQHVRGRKISMWKLWFLTSLFVAFLAGGVLGTYLFIRMNMFCMLVPAVGCTVAGVLFWIHQHWLRLQA